MEWAILTPTVMLLVLGLVQLGIWLQARSVAMQAASVVADISVTNSDDRSAAIEAGRRVATAGGLTAVEISTTLEASLITVTVKANAPLFFDLGQGAITERAVLPAERITR